MIRVRAVFHPGLDVTDLYIFRNELSVRPVTNESLVWSEKGEDYFFTDVEEGSLPPQAPFRLDDTAAQNLMDDLYRAGFRPVDARATQGQMEAMQAHLADLRLSHTTLLASVGVAR